MEEFWIFIMVVFIATNSLDKAKSVKIKLEETPLKTFDEIFGEGWWDKGEAAEDLKIPAPTNFGQSVHHQIDRQNNQIGQIEPNSTDQLGQIEPNSTDQNPPLTESDHSDNAKNGEEQNENIAEYKRKQLGLNFLTLYNWKRELGQSKPKKYPHSEQKKLMKRYYEIKGQNPKIIDKDIAKMLKIGRVTLFRWKKQFKRQQLYPLSKQKELMKRYYEIKNQNPKIIDKDIAKMLKIARVTLFRWKKQFNDVGHSVEENAVANVQEIGSSNPESF
uniref:Uncharacterized protein n=1 Tax=Globodera rostochiensis TaxID=31243 RepID=A0A914H9Q5_GLORO